MVLVRVALLHELTVPGDYTRSQLHHEVTEVTVPAAPPPRRAASSSSVAGAAACLDRPSSLNRRLGLRTGTIPSLSPLSLASSPIRKHQSVACGGARAAVMASRGAAASRPPLQPRRPSQGPIPPQRSRSHPASPPPHRALPKQPAPHRIAHPPPGRSMAAGHRARSMHAPPRRSLLACA